MIERDFFCCALALLYSTCSGCWKPLDSNWTSELGDFVKVHQTSISNTHHELSSILPNPVPGSGDWQIYRQADRQTAQQNRQIRKKTNRHRQPLSSPLFLYTPYPLYPSSSSSLSSSCNLYPYLCLPFLLPPHPLPPQIAHTHPRPRHQTTPPSASPSRANPQ